VKGTWEELGRGEERTRWITGREGETGRSIGRREGYTKAISYEGKMERSGEMGRGTTRV